MPTLLYSWISVLKKSRRRGRGWARALGPEQLLRVCEAITAGKGWWRPKAQSPFARLS